MPKCSDFNSSLETLLCGCVPTRVLRTVAYHPTAETIDRISSYLANLNKNKIYLDCVFAILSAITSSIKTMALVEVSDLSHPRADAVVHSFLRQNVFLQQRPTMKVTHFYDAIKAHFLKGDNVQTGLIRYIA